MHTHQVFTKLIIILIGISCTAATQAEKITQFDKIYIFGDSLSDTGNIHAYTKTAHKLIPKIPIIPDVPYYNGRFSNGRNWADYLATALGADVDSKHNYRSMAFGGAWVETMKDSKQPFPPGLKLEISYYLNTSFLDKHKDKHLYVIWSGGNDYRKGRADTQTATDNVTNIIRKQITRLIKHHAKYFLIPNLPDLSETPFAYSSPMALQENLHELTQAHNQKLSNMINELKTQHPDVKFYSLDIYSALNEIVANPQQYGITNATTACYDSDPIQIPADVATAMKKIDIDIEKNLDLQVAYQVSQGQGHMCDNPDEHLFFDDLHPTTRAAELITQRALYALGSVS